jgi:hypothetical protein
MEREDYSVTTLWLGVYNLYDAVFSAQEVLNRKSILWKGTRKHLKLMLSTDVHGQELVSGEFFQRCLVTTKTLSAPHFTLSSV